MKWFNNMKISARLISAFILVALIAGVVGGIGIVNLKEIEKSDQELYNNNTVSIALMSEISTSFQRIRANLRDVIIEDDPEKIESIIAKIAERSSEMEKSKEEFKKLIVTDEMKKVFEDYNEKSLEVKRQISEIQKLAKENKDDEASELIADEGTISEESAAASEELSSQADLLKTQVSRFKLKKNTSGGGSSELTPEMEKMLSVLSEKNKKAKPTKKIKLSDNEFGKY